MRNPHKMVLGSMTTGVVPTQRLSRWDLEPSLMTLSSTTAAAATTADLIILYIVIGWS